MKFHPKNVVSASVTGGMEQGGALLEGKWRVLGLFKSPLHHLVHHLFQMEVEEIFSKAF